MAKVFTENELESIRAASRKTCSAMGLTEMIDSPYGKIFNPAYAACLQTQYQKGIDYVNKALKINDRSAKAYYLKGSIYRESGDTGRAISSLETAIEQDIKYENAFIDIAVMYSARKNPIALEYYNNAIKINPYNENTIYARAKLLQDLGKTDEAIIEYKSILSKNKNC